MTASRKKVPPAVRKALVEEAGGKCANPGCANRRVHLHHIHEWHVYGTHDEKHMVALCPTCHDHAHHGRLLIDEVTLRAWKEIKAPEKSTEWAVLSVMPGGELMSTLLGELQVLTSHPKFMVFDVSPQHRLTTSILDGDLLQVDVALFDLNGDMLLRVVQNNVRIRKSKDIEIETRPGRIVVTAPAREPFVPKWVVEAPRWVEKDFAANGRIVMLDVEVTGPSALRVAGCWATKYHAIVVTEKYVHVCDYLIGGTRSFGAYGDGNEPPKIHVKGPQADAPLMLTGRTILGSFHHVVPQLPWPMGNLHQMQFPDGSWMNVRLQGKAKPSTEVSGPNTIAARFRSVVHAITAEKNSSLRFDFLDGSAASLCFGVPDADMAEEIERTKKVELLIGLNLTSAEGAA